MSANFTGRTLRWSRLCRGTGTPGNYRLYSTRGFRRRPQGYRPSIQNNKSDLGLKFRLVRVPSHRDSVITGYSTGTVTVAICTAITRQLDEARMHFSCDAVTQLGLGKRHVFQMARQSKQRALDGTYVYVEGGSRR